MAKATWNSLYHKYSHVGCPAAHMEDNCAHPDRCADNGRCIDLGPCPMDKTPVYGTPESQCGKPSKVGG